MGHLLNKGELLARYPNLYGDLSAGSGFNAITRDPDCGYRFFEEFQDKLLFGSDFCHHNQEVPIVGFIKDAVKEGRISREAYEKKPMKTQRGSSGLDELAAGKRLAQYYTDWAQNFKGISAAMTNGIRRRPVII